MKTLGIQADPVALNALAVALVRGGDCVASEPFDRNEEIRTASAPKPAFRLACIITG